MRYTLDILFYSQAAKPCSLNCRGILILEFSKIVLVCKFCGDYNRNRNYIFAVHKQGLLTQTKSRIGPIIQS